MKNKMCGNILGQPLYGKYDETENNIEKYQFSLYGQRTHHQYIVELLLQRIDRAFDLVEKGLGTVDYFAGSEFTVADILMIFPLTMI
jgi:glutathione S-transferase